MKALSIARRPALLAAVALSAAPALAHHSMSLFDEARNEEFSATVKELQWTNPHVWLQVLRPRPDGGVEEWSVEAGAVALMKKQGWTRNFLNPGDKISLRIVPMRDGTHAGGLRTLTLADGRTFGMFPKAEENQPSGPPRL